MKNIIFAVLSVLLFTTSEFRASEISVDVTAADCIGAADAAEIYSCCFIGCDGDLWRAVWLACEGDANKL